MKEPEEILKLIQHAMFSPPNRKEQDLALLEVIRQIQIEAYNKGIEDAAKSATMTGYYSEPNKYECFNSKRFKRVWENRLFKVETNIAIDKESILKLKK
jgi:hypothetical protein